jgi:hypothetical protein
MPLAMSRILQQSGDVHKPTPRGLELLERFPSLPRLPARLFGLGCRPE